ncbi:zinc knuckle CX2CX4HX4C containing protein [Tanacetum coccineum]
MSERYHMRTIRVEYEWTPSRCSSCKVFGHVLDECPKKPMSDVLENLKTPRQAVRGVTISLKMKAFMSAFSPIALNLARDQVRFKQTKQVYRPVSQKNSASISGKKKQGRSSRQEVSNLNPFDVLSSVENDDDLGTNRDGKKLRTRRRIRYPTPI